MAKPVSYEFDPWEITGVDKPRSKSKLNDAKEEVADYVIGEILSYVGEGTSPVASGKFKKSLSPEYKKIKGELSSSNFANMELHGDMLDALESKNRSGSKVAVGIFDDDQAPKAAGHNHFPGYNESKLPLREFIPKPDQKLRRDIVSGIKSILKDYEDDEG